MEDPYYRPDEESVTPHPEPEKPKYHKSFTVGGLLKIIGPRKRVRYAKKQHFTLPESPPQPRKPRWVNKIKQWSKEEGIPSTYEVGESSQAPPLLSPEADNAFEVMIARMERMSLQTQTVNEEMNIIEGNAYYLSDRVQRLRNECNHNEAVQEMARDEMNAIMMYNESQEGRISNLEYRIQTDDQQIMHTENRVRTAEERVSSVDQQFGELMEILLHMLKD